MTVWNVRDFKNCINVGADGPTYKITRWLLYIIINDKFNKGLKTLPKVFHHLIKKFYKKTLPKAKFGKQRDWIHSIQQARELNGVGATVPRRLPTSLRDWLILPA